MSKAFTSDCIIPDNPDRIIFGLPPLTLPDPPVLLNTSPEILIPSIDMPGFGCALPEVVTDVTVSTGRAGTLTAVVTPRDAAENDPCFPRITLELALPLATTCQDIAICNSGVSMPDMAPAGARVGQIGTYSSGKWLGYDTASDGLETFPDTLNSSPDPTELAGLVVVQRTLNSCIPSIDSITHKPVNPSDLGIDTPVDQDPCGQDQAGLGSDCADGTKQIAADKCRQNLQFELSLPFGHPIG